MIQIQENPPMERRKSTDRWKEGQTNRQTLFHRTLAATVGVKKEIMCKFDQWYS